MTLMNTELDDETALGRAHQPRGLAALHVVGGLIGLIASFVLTLDKLELLRNPDYVPACDLGSIVSCSNVMKSSQSEIFGFMNPLLGLVGFTIVITLGVVLFARVDLPEWIWAGMQIGTIAGLVMIHWLAFESLYRIGALCPYCMVAWSVTLPIFFYVTLRNLRAWIPGSPLTGFLRDWHALILTLWFLAFAAAIFFRFYA